MAAPGFSLRADILAADLFRRACPLITSDAEQAQCANDCMDAAAVFIRELRRRDPETCAVRPECSMQPDAEEMAEVAQ